MTTSKKAYKYSVELHIYTVNSPSTTLTTRNEIYINVCLLGMHKHTHFKPAYFPMHVDQRLYFDRVMYLIN